MKVILLEDVENVGKQYEVKEVKSGYARNFLVPKNLVKLATRDNMKWLASQKEIIEKKAEEDLKQFQEMASKIDGIEVTIPVKVGPEGQLFESITSAKVADQLKTMGFEIKKSQINLKDPIKETGEFPVKVTLGHNLESEITVIIAGEAGGKKDEEI